jgi:WD40 repeat protein
MILGRKEGPKGGEVARIIARRLGFVLLVMALAALSEPARAQSPEPVLRIESGTHSAQLRDAATDNDGRVLVTASDDKTARVWSLPDLRLLGVLRPPIGPADEGKLYAVAVSGDGRFAAVGGFTGPGPNQNNIYIFDLISHLIVQRIGDLPNVITSLAYASDGRLAAGMGTNGIRVWRDGVLQFQDTNYADRVDSLCFAPDGRLAAGASDGKLRLYDTVGRLLRTEPAQAGKRPWRSRFSPDGSLLAIGFLDAAAVELRDGVTLAPRGRPDVAGLRGPWLTLVAWGADGRTLFAAGAVEDGRSYSALSWSNAGQAARTIAADGFSDVVAALAPLPGGRLLLATLSGNIAINAPPDRNRLEGRLQVGGDLRTSLAAADDSWRLRIARDGGTVEWVTYPAMQRLLRFDPASLDFQAGGTEASNLTGWIAKADGLTATDWNSHTDPKLNGRALSLDQYEIARSVAIGQNRALLGADWHLRLFAADGMRRWERSIPGTAWRVNQSPDGRVAVATLGDSTIRWYRAENGAELLALYVTEDAQRWVAFTPKGYYAASPGAEDLIGWHVNRGPGDAADFFPASRFRDRFYRPDVVSRVIAALDEDKALREADAARGKAAPVRPITDDLPPVVTIVSPRDGTSVNGSEIELGYALRSPSGKPVSALTVLVDGQRPSFGDIPAIPTLASRDKEARGTVRVPIPPGKTVSVSLVATTDRDGEPARIQVTSKAAPVADPGLPLLNGVVAGVSHYPRAGMALEFAEKDASDIAAAFARQKGLRYRDVNLAVRPDADWTRGGILSALRELRQKNQNDDIALVFLSGHGAQSGRRTFFLPIDANPDDLDSTAISKVDLLDILADIKGRVLVLLDICHAGAFQVAGRARTVPDMTRLSGELHDTKAGLVIFASSTGTQESEELPDLQNGAFTAAVLQGLRGAALVRQDRLIQTNDLDDYVRWRVRQLTQGRQSATMVRANDVPNFPMFVLARP